MPIASAHLTRVDRGTRRNAAHADKVVWRALPRVFVDSAVYVPFPPLPPKPTLASGFQGLLSRITGHAAPSGQMGAGGGAG